MALSQHGSSSSNSSHSSISKPYFNDDWRNIKDARERKRVQNRLSQRKRRQKWRQNAGRNFGVEDQLSNSLPWPETDGLDQLLQSTGNQTQTPTPPDQTPPSETHAGDYLLDNIDGMDKPFRIPMHTATTRTRKAAVTIFDLLSRIAMTRRFPLHLATIGTITIMPTLMGRANVMCIRTPTIDIRRGHIITSASRKCGNRRMNVPGWMGEARLVDTAIAIYQTLRQSLTLTPNASLHLQDPSTDLQSAGAVPPATTVNQNGTIMIQ
ncbi:hypothetical protein BDV06DRAFT_222786 [Aspergillus oleicola]